MGGGGWEFGWGPQDDARSLAAIDRAISAGISWIDTAPVYGTGHAEEVVGRALEGRKERPHVFTKVSLRWDAQRKVAHDLSPGSIRREVEESLHRLRQDHLDLVQVHWPEPDAGIEEAWRALAGLKDEGKLLHIGVSNFDVSQMERVAAIAPVETLQPPFSLVHPEAEQEILPYARAHGIGVIAYSPLGCGLLSGAWTPERVARLPPDDWRSRSEDFREPRLSRHRALADLLARIGNDHGSASAAEVAIAWTLANPAVTGAIVGARAPEQVDGFAGALRLRLRPGDLERIAEFRETHP